MEAATTKCIGPQEHHNYLSVANEKDKVIVVCTNCGDHLSIAKG